MSLKNIFENAAGVYLGKLAYEEPEKVTEAFVTVMLLICFGLTIGMLYWAATDFPAFWDFTSNLVVSVVSFIFSILLACIGWIWEKFRAMYLVVQIPMALLVIYYTGHPIYRTLAASYKDKISSKHHKKSKPNDLTHSTKEIHTLLEKEAIETKQEKKSFRQTEVSTLSGVLIILSALGLSFLAIWWV